MMILDISGLVAFVEQAKRELDKVPRSMEQIVRTGAQYARSNHAYRNRTGNLTKSTKAVVVRKSRRDTTVNLEAGMSYASHVRKRGLMGIDQAAGRTERALQDYFDDLVSRISKGTP